MMLLHLSSFILSEQLSYLSQHPVGLPSFIRRLRDNIAISQELKMNKEINSKTFTPKIKEEMIVLMRFFFVVSLWIWEIFTSMRCLPFYNFIHSLVYIIYVTPSPRIQKQLSPYIPPVPLRQNKLFMLL